MNKISLSSSSSSGNWGSFRPVTPQYFNGSSDRNDFFCPQDQDGELGQNKMCQIKLIQPNLGQSQKIEVVSTTALVSETKVSRRKRNEHRNQMIIDFRRLGWGYQEIIDEMIKNGFDNINVKTVARVMRNHGMRAMNQVPIEVERRIISIAHKNKHYTLYKIQSELTQYDTNQKLRNKIDYISITTIHKILKKHNIVLEHSQLKSRTANSKI